MPVVVPFSFYSLNFTLWIVTGILAGAWHLLWLVVLPLPALSLYLLRTAPCLLGLFSVVCLIFAEHTKRHRIRVRRTKWYIKAEPTFSDAMATVRRLFWQETIFEKAPYHKGFKKLPPKLRNLLLDYLSQAA